MKTLIVYLILAFAGIASAQELVTDTVVTLKARVVEVRAQETREVPGTDITALHQTIVAEILEEPEQGTRVTIDNDYLELEEGDVFYLNHTTSAYDGTDYYSVLERDRTPALAALLLLFVAVVVLFGGKQGARGLLALIGSFVIIWYFLLPRIIQSYSPF